MMDDPDNPDRTRTKGLRRRTRLAAVLALGVVAATGAIVYDRTTSRGGHRTVYVNVPAMVVNIRSADGRPHFLKVRLTLEVGSQDKEAVTEREPAFIDAAQGFLREIRPEDLNGTAAMFRIKEELLIRANRSVGERQVSDVLIQELVLQ